MHWPLGRDIRVLFPEKSVSDNPSCGSAGEASTPLSNDSSGSQEGFCQRNVRA